MRILRKAPVRGALEVLLATSLFLVPDGAFLAGADWPMFRGNSAHTGVAEPPKNMLLHPRLVWSFESGDGPVESSAAIVGGFAYVGSWSGELLALDLNNGKPKWRFKIGADLGIRSSPAVSDGRIFFGDDDGVFRAISVEKGEEIWKYQTDAEIISSPNVVGHRVIFGSYDNHLYCLDARDGKLLWKLLTDERVHASPSVANGVTLIAGCDGLLRAIDIETGLEIHQTDLRTNVLASPAMSVDPEETRAYVGTYDCEFVGVDWKKESLEWTYQHPTRRFPFLSSPALRGDRIIVSGRDKLVHAIHRLTGTALWEFQARARMESSPVICGGGVFVGSYDGELYLLDLVSGKKIWSFTAGAPILASPSVGNGRLVVGADDGRIYCFDLRASGDSPTFPIGPIEPARLPPAVLGPVEESP